jgi:multiple sugar transport system ATP-binding protein
MARIDLINVCATLAERGARRPAAAPEESATPGAARGRDATFAIENLNLTVPDGRTMVVLGPSGCGKTTLLKLIAGLIPLSSGQVRFNGVDVKDVSTGERRIGMVFQNYALYPHFTSRTNVLSYFLFRKKTPQLNALAAEKYRRTSELMGVELEHLLDRMPTTLSGGEKQRVALGRCITRNAEVFLVDEPFANLDQALRERYRVNLKALLRQFDITTVYVTHDHNEALILADLVAVMTRGRIEQVGTFQELYDEPDNVFVAGFLNVHSDTPPINLLAPRPSPAAPRRGPVRVGVRPEDVEVSTTEQPDGVKGVVTGGLRLPMKHAAVLTIRAGEDEIHARVADAELLAAGTPVWLAFRRHHLFDPDSGARLATVPETR